MAGNLREFAMPAAVPAATPAGSKKMPDSQEALYKRMRLEPIGTDYTTPAEKGMLVKLKKQAQNYGTMTRKDKAAYEILKYYDDQYLDEEHNEDADGVEIIDTIKRLRETTGLRDAWVKLKEESVYEDPKSKRFEILRKTAIDAKNLLSKEFNKLFETELPIFNDPSKPEPESESEASSVQNLPKPGVQPQQPKPTSSTTQQGPTTPRDTNPRLLLNPQASSSSTPTPAAAATTATTPQQPEVKHLEADLDLVLRSGLQPLYSFIGMVGASLGDQDVRSYYKWRGVGASMDELQSPVAKGAANLEEFVRKNSHLGRPLLQYALKIGLDKAKEGKMLKQIGEQMIPSVIQDERYIIDLLDGSYLNKTRNAAEAQWTWGAIDEAVLAYILQDSALGAIHLAHSVIKSIPRCWDFTLKELLMSDGVNAMFAKFVGWEFLQASGGNAYGRSSSSTSRGMVKGSTFMLSAGFATRQALYAQVAVAKIWFEDVRRISNPLRAELDAFIERSRVLLRAYGGAYDRTSTPKLKDNGEDEWGVLATLRELLMNTKGNPAEKDYAAYLNLRINLYIAEEKRRYMPPYVLRHCE